jgi:MFS family permease
MGIYAAAQAVGLCLGPVIGGVLVGTYGWRSIFWATVPFGAGAVVLGWVVLPQTAHASRHTPLDWIGALLLTPALVALVFALNHAAALGLASPLLLGCVIAFVILITLHIRWERVAAFPLVNLNAATLSAASAESSGEAGAMLNLMRSLGTGIGIAAASSMLTWRMRDVTLYRSGDFTFGGHPLLAAAESSFVMLMIFAAIAGGISFVRAPGSRQLRP